MSFIPLNADNIENAIIIANPKHTFSSSSVDGTTGSLDLSFDRASNEYLFLNFQNSIFDDKTPMSSLEDVSLRIYDGTTTSAYQEVNDYLELIKRMRQGESQTSPPAVITRVSSSNSYNSSSLKKSFILNTLYPYYRNASNGMHWAYTNYNTLNLFTASNVNRSACLFYPNYDKEGISQVENATFVPGVYSVSGAFTIQFYINPRYTENNGGSFKAGTILHLSSSYAVSLASGSSRNLRDEPDRFRIVLQLSHSADISPSKVDLSIENNKRSLPNDLIFTSTDNSLSANNWHHVAITWGTNVVSAGTGSIFIDGVLDSQFVVPSASICPTRSRAVDLAPQSTQDPAILCVGNYYEGINDITSASPAPQYEFFNTTKTNTQGVRNLVASTNAEPEAILDHPLNAELHEIRIYSKGMTQHDIISSSLEGVSKKEEHLRFYLPVLFTKESPNRYLSDLSAGNVLTSPFSVLSARQDSNITTEDAFNVESSFRVGSLMVNVENFLRDFATDQYPLLHHLSASALSTTVAESESSQAINAVYHDKSLTQRNLLILPCDNGKFTPSYSLLLTGSYKYQPDAAHGTSKFVNDFGVLDTSLISLNDLVPEYVRLATFKTDYNQSIDTELCGITPENPTRNGGLPGSDWAVYQRLRDSRSNEQLIFNISNLFYGRRIKPKTLRLKDTALTGSSGKVKITLVDDGRGSLYRADSHTTHAKWNTVGNAFYNEGLVIIKSPHISKFGKDAFSIDFSGEQIINTMKLFIPTDAGRINSSSNPSYDYASASFDANQNDASFVFISDINIHDENLNVVMKASLAQPIKKRSSDRIVFKPKLDW